jgi:Flp pilus assembly protein TadB
MFRTPHTAMHHEQNRFQTAFSAAPASLAGRLLGFAGAVIAAVLAFMFSIAALAVVAVVGTLLGGWLWWKTRAVRRQMHDAMQAQAQQRPPGGHIIEGEVVREPETAIIRRLPD